MGELGVIEQSIDHLGASFFAESPVDFDFVFLVSEGSVTGVGGGRDFQFRMALPGVKIQSIGGQASQRAAKFSMLELPLIAALFQELRIVTRHLL